MEQARSRQPPADISLRVEAEGALRDHADLVASLRGAAIDSASAPWAAEICRMSCATFDMRLARLATHGVSAPELARAADLHTALRERAFEIAELIRTGRARRALEAMEAGSFAREARSMEALLRGWLVAERSPCHAAPTRTVKA
ncbi:hypothetical protein [Roseivivax marinus]|uniref:hypothetical protein n=1 Tax=Roseivivax marinus TaxID=1379903 RepID=UPI00273ECCF3|nr:hypothetical protein [Roseivivax marinus]